MLKRFLFAVCLICLNISFGQNIQFGYTFGVAFSFGTHVNRLGLSTAAYANTGFSQISATAKFYYDFQSFALKQKTPEIQLGIGPSFGFGRTDTLINPFIGISEHNLPNNYAIGYTFLRYWDKQGTSQSTGIVHAHVQNVSFSMENDLFGNFFNQQDRYRTGAFAVEYRFGLTKIGISSSLWTHDYKHCPVVTDETSTEWTEFGYYKDDEVGKRHQSLGTLAAYGRQLLPFNQEAVLYVGVEGEKIRNFFQNKLIHDQPMLPRKMVWRKPPHIPMITEDNNQYIYQKDQKIKPLEFYFNASANTLPFF